MKLYCPGLGEVLEYISNHILAVVVIVYMWWHEHVISRSRRCSKSPDGMHFVIAKGMRPVCKYCGEVEERGKARGSGE